jgi:hypothetical protein
MLSSVPVRRFSRCHSHAPVQLQASILPHDLTKRLNRRH